VRTGPQRSGRTGSGFAAQIIVNGCAARFIINGCAAVFIVNGSAAAFVVNGSAAAFVVNGSAVMATGNSASAADLRRCARAGRSAHLTDRAGAYRERLVGW